MRRQSALRNVVITLGAAAVVATMLPRAATAEGADKVCRDNAAAATTDLDPPFIEISQGRMVIGSPIQRLDLFDACQVARWREPENGHTSMLAFVYNDSEQEVFHKAQLLIESKDVGVRANSRPIPIDPLTAGVFLFVGPIRTIELHGKYRGRVVEFQRRGAPENCTEFTVADALEAMETFEPGSTIKTTLDKLDPDDKLHIMYIEVDDTIMGESDTQGQPDTNRVTAYLADNRDAPAHVVCRR